MPSENWLKNSARLSGGRGVCRSSPTTQAAGGKRKQTPPCDT